MYIPPDNPNLALQLPADAYYHLIRTLNNTLPPPPSDSPEDLTRQYHSVIARIAALLPANAAEADIAGTYVIASEQWKDALRAIQQPDISPEKLRQSRAWANSMMRQAQSAIRLLQRMQAIRQKTEADNKACDGAAWTEHCAISLMAEALSPRASQPAADPPPAPEPVADLPAPAPGPADKTQPEPAPAALPEPAPVTAAEQYAAIYPERAALIRRLGRVPDNVPFGPPDDDLVQALLEARTPAFATLDRRFAELHAT
jgi:hypothetical protein